MAIYRGEGGATDVEAAPGNTEFAGGIIVEKDAVVKGNLTVNGEIYGDGSNLTGIPSVEDTYTKDEIDASQAEQDVVIDTKLGDAPVDGIMYGRKDSLWQTLPVGDNVYTKAEIDVQQAEQDANILANSDGIADLNDETYDKIEIDEQQLAQDVLIQANTDAIASLPTPVDTYTKSEIDASQNAQDTVISTNTGNISNNTTAIGDLSGRVLQNEEDIEVLNEGMFFSSTYEARYPGSPNRTPGTGDLYLQKNSAFTYSYSECNIIYVSKTDQMGNVRPYTALQVGDKLILNQGDGSPNFGRYKVLAIDKQTEFVVLTVSYVIGQGSVINGDTVGLQAFPASSGGSGDGIPEAPIDGKQYGRQDATWTEITGGGDVPTPEALVWEDRTVARALDTVYTNTNDVPLYVQITAYSDGATNEGINRIDFQIDGKAQGSSGSNGDKTYDNTLYVVPSGSTFSAVTKGVVRLDLWQEAKMPLAIAVGGASGGGTTDILPVLLSGTVFEDGVIGAGEDFTCNKTGTGKYTITFNTPRTTLDYSVTALTNTSYVRSISVANKSETKFDIWVRDSSSNDFVDGTFDLTVTGTDTIAVGGGSGSYTPEDMVWEDKTANRAYNTEYTNTNDVPLYISVTGVCREFNSYIDLYVDGVRLVIAGNTASSDAQQYADIFGIVPSGSTYEVKAIEASGDVALWNEAKMPVAVGTGGKTVTFRSGGIVPGQTPTTNADYSIQFDTPETSEGGTFDGTYFTPNTEGWYQLSGSVFISAPTSSRVGCIIQKNGSSQLGSFNQGITALGGGGISTSGLVYCNGTTDKLSLAIVCSEAVGAIGGATNTTWFSAHLVTGQSSGGGSYTPEKMVWKQTNDPIRTFDTVYTNDDDAPRFVNINIKYYSAGDSSCKFFIDGVEISQMGRTATPDAQHLYTTQMFVIPSGSTYELKQTKQSSISQWWEATMPLAIGTGGGSGTPSSFARIVDEKPEGVAAEDSVVGIQQRKLNKIVSDDDGIVTLSEDLNFTLQAGTYVIDYSAPVFQSNYTKIYLHSVTDNAMADEGTSGYDGSDITSGRYGGQYIVTLTEPHTYQVQQYIQNSATNGLGLPCASGVGIFTTVDIQKVGSGGSASGGGYTPETFVWEDKKLERDFATYTNDWDVPRYVEIGITALGDTDYAYTNFLIDGEYHASLGKQGLNTRDMSQGMFIVPAGSTYTLEKDGNAVIGNWWEARMPVALGAGDSLWTDVDGVATYDGDVNIKGGTLDLRALTTGADFSTIKSDAENGINFDVYGSTRMSIKSGGVTTSQDMTVNGITVGRGKGNKATNTVVGNNALVNNADGQYTTAFGNNALENSTANGNSAFGIDALKSVSTGSNNTGLGNYAGSSLTTGRSNVLIGENAQPSSPDVSNEVTIGNDSITSTRLKGQVTFTSLPIGVASGGPNLYAGSDGVLFRLETTYYTTEEVDKKLAIKDKLIEKLSARLDALEQKFNNVGGK